MDSKRNVAAKKTVSRPLQESSLHDNAHHGNVQNGVLLHVAANSEMVFGVKLPLCKMIAHPNTLVQDTALIDAQDGHTPEQETNPSSSGVMMLEGLEIRVIR